MPELELVNMLASTGTTAVFLYLYLQERKRVRELADSRIADCKDWTELLIRMVATKEYPTPLSPDVPLFEAQNERRGQGG